MFRRRQLPFDSYLQQLEERHFANLTFSEVTRALRALSSTYVERRETALAANKALDGAGKRAAFALYYGPLHFLLLDHIFRHLIAPSVPDPAAHDGRTVVPDPDLQDDRIVGSDPNLQNRSTAGSDPNLHESRAAGSGTRLAPGTVVDLGCGTGVGGAAVATAIGAAGRSGVRVLGIDTHPWALDEARFTYKAFGLPHDVRRGDAAKATFPGDTSMIVAAFVVNELNDRERAVLLERLIRLKTAGSRIPDPGFRHILIVEPISQRISPWWDQWAAEFAKLGGRSDTWKARIEAPPMVKRLAKASGLRPELLTARSLFV